MVIFPGTLKELNSQSKIKYEAPIGIMNRETFDCGEPVNQTKSAKKEIRERGYDGIVEAEEEIITHTCGDREINYMGVPISRV